jgi:hypothetical protein
LSLIFAADFRKTLTTFYFITMAGKIQTADWVLPVSGGGSSVYVPLIRPGSKNGCRCMRGLLPAAGLLVIITVL